MKVVITGVPGTGKTTLAKALSKKLCVPVVDVNAVLTKEKCWIGRDKFGAKVARLGKLRSSLIKLLAGCGDCVVEGHLACEFGLPVDCVIVLRTRPDVLRARLKKRNYSKEKAEQNVLCELLDYCTLKSEQHYRGVCISEIDSSRGASETLRKAVSVLSGKPSKPVSWVRFLEKEVF